MADEDGRRRLGRVVVRARSSLGLDRKELAAACGLSYPYVAQIENGDREPSLRALQALSGALGIRLEELTTALEYDGAAPAPRSSSLASSKFLANPGFAGSPPPTAQAAPAPAPAPASAGSIANGSPLTRRSRGSSARRAVVTELHELLEQLDPEERLTVLGELQGLVLADLVRHELRQR